MTPPIQYRKIFFSQFPLQNLGILEYLFLYTTNNLDCHFGSRVFFGLLVCPLDGSGAIGSVPTELIAQRWKGA